MIYYVWDVCLLSHNFLPYFQKYKVVNDDSNMVSEPSSPQSSTRSRSPSPDDILERVAADVKEYERENLNTFEASIKAKHNLIAQEKDGNVLVTMIISVGIQDQLNEPHCQVCAPWLSASVNMQLISLKIFVKACGILWQDAQIKYLSPIYAQELFSFMCKLARTQVNHCPKHIQKWCFLSMLVPPYLLARSMITLVAKKWSIMYGLKSLLKWEEE